MDADRLPFIEEEIDLRYYIGLLRRHFKTIVSAAIIVGAVSSIYVFKLPDVYEAESQVLIQQETQPTPYTEFKNPDLYPAGEVVYFNTQIEILKSVGLLGKAVEENNLLEPLLDVRKVKPPKDLPQTERIKIGIGIIQAGLRIQRIKDTRIFTISFRSGNPIICKEVTNAVASSYVKRHLEQKLYIPKELLQYFPEDADKVQLQTSYGQLQQVSKQDVARTLPSVVNDPLVRQLQSKAAEAEAQVLKLREVYKEKHPKVIEAKSTLQFIKDRIRIETDTIIKNLKTTLANQLQLSNVRILKEAEVPFKAVGPKRLRMMLMAILGSIMLCSTLIFIVDFLDDTVKSQEDIERFVQIPFLGHIPFFREKFKDLHQKAFLVHYNPLSEISESFRFIKVAINFSGAPGTLKCLLVTSAVPSEGKSLVATNLAATFLRDGEKILLVDADLRHPTVHMFTNTENRTGLSNYLASNMEFSEIVQKTTIPQLEVVSAGPLSPNPTELFSSYRMENFIREAKANYDRIIVDSPPVIGLADSIVIGTKSDGVIFLIQSRHVSRNLAKKAKQRLLETGAKVLGVVLNKVDVEKENPAYHYFAQGYYHYYGKRKDGSEGENAHSSSG